jgi:hypothetical protein
MPGKVNIYNPGAFGVQRTNNPLQVKDGELLSSQNGVPRLYRGRLALSKRDGMNKINATTAAGAILAIYNLPFSEEEEVSGDPVVFLAGSSTGTDRIQTSEDGSTWTLRNDNLGAGSPAFGVRCIAYSPSLDLLVAVGHNGSQNAWFATCDNADLDTWTIGTAGTTPAAHNWDTVCWSETLGLFVAMAQVATPSKIATSPDGTTWTFRTNAHASHTYIEVIWVDALGIFIGISDTAGSTRGHMVTSPDGITWTERTYDATATASMGVSGVAWSDSQGVAVACVRSTGVGVANKFFTSPDGITWTRRTAPFDVQYTDVEWSADLGLFVAVAQTGTNAQQIATSPDGVTWTARSCPTARSWKYVKWRSAQAAFFIVGTGTDKLITSTDGTTWTEISTAISQDWQVVI